MAIIQISKIQQRSGNLVDLPQLDEAQFGWATDAKRLFIGKTSPNENIEVLTSYSNISFSQIDGSGNSNVYISNASLQPGQVLTYDSTINSWINTGGNSEDPGNSSYFSGQPVHLGSVSNVKIGDGAVGYVLTTDGYGNLSWTPKTSVVSNIIAISTANPAVMTFDPNVTNYTNGTAITVLGVEGNTSATNLNGNTFYLKIANDFGTTGNASLYISDALDAPNAFNGTGISYTNSPNATATNSYGSGGGSPAAGTEGSIQYNVSGVLTGSTLLKFANSNVEISTSNVVVTNGNVSANLLTGTLTTASQPNITSTGTLAGLVVAGNITPSANVTYNLGNSTNRFNDLYLANSTIYIGSQTISANATNVIISGLLTANVSGNISGNAATAGTVTTNAQPNITSVGILSSLSVSGNITTGNLNGANSITANYFIGSGNNLSNIQGANVTGAVSYASTANSVALANVSGAGNIASINLNGNTTQVLYGNGVFATAATTYGNSDVSTFLASYGSNTITTTGNVSVGNIIGNGQALTAIAGANVTGVVANATYATNAGTAYAVAGANVTGNVGNALNAYAVAAANVSGLGNVAVLNKDGNGSNVLFGNGVFATLPVGGYGNSNVASFLAAYGSNTISTTGNVTSGNLVTSKYLINSVQTGISAAGSTQGTGTALANTVNIVSTVSSGNGVVLPTAIAGMTIYITNTSANSLLVYPATGATINELATNAALTQLTKATVHYVAASSTQWYSVGGTYA
jgi:hypothetical protein